MEKTLKLPYIIQNIEDNDQIDTMAANLKDAGVDYDMFGLSFYRSGTEPMKICRTQQN